MIRNPLQDMTAVSSGGQREFLRARNEAIREYYREQGFSDPQIDVIGRLANQLGLPLGAAAERYDKTGGALTEAECRVKPLGLVERLRNRVVLSGMVFRVPGMKMKWFWLKVALRNRLSIEP